MFKPNSKLIQLFDKWSIYEMVRKAETLIQTTSVNQPTVPDNI